jgi:hypothetical protein
MAKVRHGRVRVQGLLSRPLRAETKERVFWACAGVVSDAAASVNAMATMHFMEAPGVGHAPLTIRVVVLL